MNSHTHHKNVLQLDAVTTPEKRRFNLSKITLALFVLSTLVFSAQPVLAGGDHAPAAKESSDSVTQTAPTDEHGEQALKLTETQQALAGISLLPLSSDSLNITNLNLDIRATATLVVDRDRTATLAPQLDVRVLARHVVPGQEVKKGEPLLTLGGAAVAQAQADYINAAAEWSRVKRMSEGAVSVSRRMQAQVDAELKRAILEAIKMTPTQIRALESTPEAIGSYQLLAPIDGRVQQDIAMLGQVFSAGTPLMQLTDESYLWVEAQLTPTQTAHITVGGPALVQVGDKTLAGKIIGRSHELDSVTRTEQVLVSMPNPDHVLHAGQFAELYFAGSTTVPNGSGIVLPDAALTRGGDGDWQIFIQDEDGFESIEVEVVQRQRGLSLVRGPELEKAQQAQLKVVVAGAFFLASEQAKAGFDIHAH
ncbi:MAG: efflux RND transporter periplasmic adaptor subunit [Gammaproteobacteria bacterium]|nr:efflux RND transporter periplasmic adaptor subunit [Gammaproteobacteria bacterium]MBU1478827.1 efflux RND transporter periplasmic adaptor subunit [Gammaproteobacteria bacterium]MBU2003269.1 efflux RND transporter periplasmic adaptor subunit [Gammaproteobacteria bacterium]MBU2132721.1 efflux RND transporter periplasmic adaptor subunit [Gammaproteobacteria bacterium]MBU2188271.1 efflux RND transporter periplasmic adaptor subunit [Gammaproteobacteria bacterium]